MKITDTHVYFWTGIYSNWHPVTLYDAISDIQFENSEQAFMWLKASFFNDKESCDLIQRTPDPRKAKELGRNVKNFDDAVWAEHRYNFMEHACFLKFSQNEELMTELLNTGDRVMVEASPYDLVWGVGLKETDPLILDEKNWKGKNLLGKALMEVRERLK